MRAIWLVLTRAVVGGFYRAYAGWLATAAFLVGAVMSGREHKMLILAALADERVLAGALLLPWALYTLLTMRFAGRVWSLPENEVLRQFWLISSARRWFLGLGVQVLLLAPLWAYAVVVTGFAIPLDAWQPLMLAVSSLTLLTILGWGTHEMALRGPVRSITGGRIAQWRVSAALWWLHERFTAQPLGFLLQKLISIGLVIGLCSVYRSDTFDVRILTLGALLTGLTHALLPGALYAWERERLPWLWNLPIGPGRRLMGHARLFSLLLLPELLAWLRWCPVTGPERFWWAFRLWAFPVAWLLLLWSLLLWRPVVAQQQTTRVLVLGFAVYLLLMGRVPLELLTLVGLTGAAALTYACYWRAEDLPLPAETNR